MRIFLGSLEKKQAYFVLLVDFEGRIGHAFGIWQPCSPFGMDSGQILNVLHHWWTNFTMIVL